MQTRNTPEPGRELQNNKPRYGGVYIYARLYRFESLFNF